MSRKWYPTQRQHLGLDGGSGEYGPRSGALLLRLLRAHVYVARAFRDVLGDGLRELPPLPPLLLQLRGS